ncbi:MAG: hypothetical protein ABR879_08275 [Methanomassiliicoccales archaeon]
MFSDVITYGHFGYLYYPNWSIGLILPLIAPLAIMMSIGINVLVSSRVNDVRTAYNIGTSLVIPFAALYVASAIGAIRMTVGNLLLLAAILAVVDLAVFYLVIARLKREEILTKWK